MKKLLFTLLCALVACNFAAAQPMAYRRDSDKKIIVDSCNLSITYRVRISRDTLGDRHYFDNQILEIGDKLMRYYSLYAEDMDSVYWKAHKENAQGIVFGGKNLKRDENGTYEDLFFDYPEKGTLTYTKRFAKNNYLYTEDIPVIDWAIKDDIDTVIGCVCQKAITDFRGRTYTAWFTSEIPVSVGPWKFGGLPGMILKVSDTDNYFTYTAIEIKSNRKPIYKYDLPYIKTKPKEMAKLMDLEWKDMKMLMDTNGFPSAQAVPVGSEGVAGMNAKHPQPPCIPRHER